MPSSELSAAFFYVYYLYAPSHGEFYVGFTNNLKRRVEEHNQGLNQSTKAYKPWKLIYYESHTNRDDARRREKYLKTTAGRQALRKMLREKLNELTDLSQQKVYY